MANERFQKVMVFTNPGTEFITTNTLYPKDLTTGQIGAFKVDDGEVPGVGTGATPSPNSIQRIQFHQNVGDNKYGTVRTKTIEVGSVRRYYKANPAAAVTEVWYIGYDEADNTKDIQVPCGMDLLINVVIFSKKLAQWYGTVPGYRKGLVINTGCCAVGAPDAIVDRDFIANAIVAAWNASNARTNDFPVGNELKTFITAVKVTTGTPGASDYRVGVKLTSVAIPETLLNLCDPVRWNERDLVTFAVSFRSDCQVNVPITKFRSAAPGTGWAAELASLESESQGYDRVREVYADPRFMLTNYILRATTGVKHDYLYLEYNWTHSTNGTGHPQSITEPYTIMFASPTTATLQPVADHLNAWLVNRFPAVTI